MYILSLRTSFNDIPTHKHPGIATEYTTKRGGGGEKEISLNPLYAMYCVHFLKNLLCIFSFSANLHIIYKLNNTNLDNQVVVVAFSINL